MLLLIFALMGSSSATLLSCAFLEEVLCHNFPKGEIVVPLDWLHYAKKNMEVLQGCLV